MTNETNFHELSFVQSLEFRYFSNRSKKYIDEFLKLLEDFNLDVEFEINDNLRNYNCYVLQLLIKVNVYY